jgi:hypothetical protein
MNRLITIIILLLFFAEVSAQEDKSVIVTGMGVSMEDARKNAFITAVEQSLGVMVSSDVLIENGNLIKEKIRSNSTGYIENYSIISSGKDGDIFIVTIKATVSGKKVQTTLDEITHINDALLSYEAVKCQLGYKNSIWCKGGDIAIGNMNFGIHSDSYALLRYYTGDITENQLYFHLTLREKGYFYEAKDQDGKNIELKYVDMQSDSNNSPGRTVTEDFILVLDSGNFTYLKKFIYTGLEVKVIGSKTTVTIKIPGAYIEGFKNYIEENIAKSK